MQLFDRKTGAVDEKVLAYWAQHYDLSNIVERTWMERGPLLTGRIHLLVGTADTFYLDGAAHKFEARLKRLARSRTLPIRRGAATLTCTW